MKLRNVLLIGTACLLAMTIALPMMAATASTPAGPQTDGIAQEGPTATPNDPSWLGFVAARAALSEELDRRITYVRRWQFAQTEFTFGINDNCTTLEEGVEEPKVYFGWRYIISLLEGGEYEIRVSFDLETVLVCDEVTSSIGGGGGDTEGGSIPTDIGNVAEGPMEIGAQVPNTLGGNTIQFLNRGNFTWVKAQAKTGQEWAGFISQAQSNGFKVLLSVLGNKDRIMEQSYRDEYVAYLASLAAAGADAIEVWNEPNLEREWTTGQISGSNYTGLLQQAYPAIKAANPNTIVISAGPAPTGAFGEAGCTAQGCNDDVFYQQMAQAGAAQYADCIGVHYNEGIVSPLQNSGDPRDNYPTRYFQSNFNRAMSNFPGMTACITEIGYLTPDGYGTLPGPFAWAQDTSVEEQAEWIAQAAVLSSQLGNVRLFIVFNLNFDRFVGDDPQGGYALVRPDGSCPGCDTLAAAQ
ncbi:MAG: hypothetical protein GYB66_02585 [Chloroflexi bacterium]|nr:hypothetical protein [Chloroflexota bacterium]